MRNMCISVTVARVPVGGIPKTHLMSTTPVQAERNHIPFGNQVLNFKEDVGKGLRQGGKELLEALETWPRVVVPRCAGQRC